MIKCFKCQNTIESKNIYGLHENCFIEWFSLARPEPFKSLDPKKTSSTLVGESRIQKNNDTFYHGRYQKYSAHLGQTEYILKVQEAKYPELPFVEYLCNQIAALLDIDIPPYYLINFNGQITFVTRNFMQDYTGTLDHIYKFLPKGEENHNCEEIINLIQMQTGKFADVAKFIEICLFDTLIGNNDRHGRNLGIITTASIKKLAPMYDNPSCIGIEEDFFLASDIDPSGSIWTKTSTNPKPLDYVNEFTRLGHREVVIQFCNKIVSQSSTIVNAINNAELSQKRKNTLMKLFQKRLRDFEHVK